MSIITALSTSHRVFYYHNVGDNPDSFYPEGISTAHFELQIKALLRLGYRFSTLREAYASAGKRRGLTATITTDDGFDCNYTTIFPILKRYNIPLTLFIIGKCHDNQALAWNHKLLIIRKEAQQHELHEALLRLEPRYDLKITADLSASLFSVPMKRKEAFADQLWEQFCHFSQAEYLQAHQPFLSADQLSEMVSRGCEIATHSHSHADFSRWSLPEIYEEIHLSKAILEQYGPVEFFAFPYGRQPQPDLIPHICRKSGLKACLGGRYTFLDNRRRNHYWQRQKLELPLHQSALEFIAKPLLRTAKDLISLP